MLSWPVALLGLLLALGVSFLFFILCSDRQEYLVLEARFSFL